MFLTLQPNFPTLNQIFHCYTVDRFYRNYVLTQYQVTGFAHTWTRKTKIWIDAGIIGTAKASFICDVISGWWVQIKF